MSSLDIEKLAQSAFTVYTQTKNSYSPLGNTIPPLTWRVLPQNVRAGWIASTEKIFHDVKKSLEK